MSRSSKSKARSAKSTMVRVQFDPSLKSALVHLPMTLYAPLVDLAVPPQSLVVELDPSPSNPDAGPYYTGWSGMSAAPSSISSSLSQQPNEFRAVNGKASASDVVSLSPSLAASFTPPLKEGSICSIRLLRSPPLPTASKIEVTPLSADDWEILSLHAEEVEMNMLGQVRAATTRQVLAVHVGRGGKTVVRFRVDATMPSTASRSSEDDLDEDNESTGIAVRLTTDSEVIIAPRLRKSEADPAAQEEHHLHTAKSLANGTGGDQYVQHLRQTVPKLLWRVLPDRFGQGLDLNNITNAVAIPASNSSIAVGYTQLQQIYPDGRFTITKVSCPTNNAASEVSAVGRDKATSSTRFADSADAGARVGDIASSSNSSLPNRPTASSRFVSMPSITANQDLAKTWPDRHVFIGAVLRKQLGITDYDLVRFGAPPPGSSKSSKPPLAVSVESAEHTSDDPSSEIKLAGIDHILQCASDTVAGCFKTRNLGRSWLPGSASKPFLGSSSFLLTGGPGAGKTVVAKKVASLLATDFDLRLSMAYFDCSPFSEERVSVLRARFSEWLNDAAWKSPSLLILDNLDRIIPAEVEHVESQRARQLAEAFVSRVRDCLRSFSVFIMATAQSNTSLHGLLNSSHIWIDNLQLKPPTKEGRRDILTLLVRQKQNLTGCHVPTQQSTDLNFVTLANQTEGYLPADLRDLVERATHQAAIRAIEETDARKGSSTFLLESAQASHAKKINSKEAIAATPHYEESKGLSISTDDFVKAQEGFTPLSLRDVKLEKSSVAWSDIGGLVETRRVLRETLEWPTKYAAIFASCPLRLRSGLLLYGYPGCGKTLLASAVAKECGLNFISVKGPEILNKYIGASEKSVRDLFDRAQAAKPCVLFFDEFDSIAPKRGHDSTGVTDRVVNQMLTQVDGAEGLDGVYVLAATSRPDLIDSALLRPGRLDKSLLCDMPTAEDRVDIMRAVSGKVHLHPDVDLRKWASRTEGFSGADLQALIYNAHLEAIHESINSAAADPAEKAERNSTDKGVRFVSFGGDSSSKSAGKTLSGAEKQALSRKLELVLEAQAEQRASQRAQSHRILPELAMSSAANGSNSVQATSKLKSNVLVTERHLETSLQSTRPSVPAEEQRRLRKIYTLFAGDRDGHFPDGEASQEIGARSSLM